MVAAVLLTSAVCFASSGTWVYQNPLPRGQSPAGVSAVDSTHVWQVGANGYIAFYNGTTLTRQASGTSYNLYAVYALDSTHVWAAGEAGTILFYNGTSWAQQGIGVTAYKLQGVWAADSTHVWAVCDSNNYDNATVLFYNGSSWSVQFTYASGGILDVFGYDSSHVWAVDSKTYFYNGSNWQMVNDGSTPHCQPYVGTAVSATEIWAVSWWGDVLKSTDAGTTWVSQWSDSWPSNICSTSSKNIWVVGWGGKTSYYDGTSWTPYNNTDTTDLFDASATTAGGSNIYTVGAEKFFTTKPAWTTSTTLTQQLYSVAAITPGNVWVAGAGGYVFHYNGTSWDSGYKVSSAGGILYGISADSATDIWVVGADQKVFHNTTGVNDVTGWDTGKSLARILYSVSARTSSDIWVGAASGYTFHNTTGNNSTGWDAGYAHGTGIQQAISADSATDIWAGGAAKIPYHNTTGNNLTGWSAGSAFTSILYGMSALTTTDAWAVGASGLVAHYTGSWSTGTAGTSALYGVHDTAANDVWAVGAAYKAYHYTGSWDAGTTLATSTLESVDASGTNDVWTVGLDKKVYHYSLSSAWSAVTAGVATNLSRVSAATASCIWAVGPAGVIDATSNGGLTWATQTSGTTNDINGIDAVSSTVAYAACSYGTGNKNIVLVYSSGTWSTKNPATPLVNLYGITSTPSSPTTCWAVGASGAIRKGTSSGGTWATETSGVTTQLNGVSAADANYVFAAGNTDGTKGTLLRTTNGGTAWSRYTTGVPNIDFNGVSGINVSPNYYAWAVGDGGNIWYTSNGGTTWSAQTSPTTNDLYDVSATALNNVWAVGASGTILHYDGTSWAVHSQSGSVTTNNLKGVSAYNASNAWAVGDNGTIIYADPPFIKQCYPTWGSPGQALTVDILGGYTNFDPSSTVGLGAGITASNIRIIGNTELTADIFIDPNATPGPRDVTVTTPDVATGSEVVVLPNGFTVGSEPTITGVTTNYGVPGWTGDVVVNGSETHFGLQSQGNFGNGITANYIKDIQPDQATVNITIAPDAALGKRDVNITTGSEPPSPLLGGFTVLNTPNGDNVDVQPNSETTLDFEKVTSPGITTSDKLADPEINKYRVATGTCYDIKTTATFAGDIEVTLSYSGFSQEDASRLVILHNENGSWVDRTVSRDTVAKTVTGKVSSLSQFVVALPVSEPPLPPAPSKLSKWYLAEGSTAWGFSTYINILNPNQDDVTVGITYMTPTGQVKKDFTLTKESQLTLNPKEDLGGVDFSTLVECKEGKPIAVDRRMVWNGPEASSSIGVNSPAKTWYLPEGSTAWGFECWLLIQNPNDTNANCHVTFMTENDGAKTFDVTVPPNARRTYNVADFIGQADTSIKVESDVPVIPERAMYRNNRREGEGSIGTMSPSKDYYLAEGCTNYGFTTYVLVQNPNDQENQITLTYMTSGGPVTEKPFTMPANSRKTIRVNGVLPSQDLSTHVQGTLPVVAERAMYWNNGTGEAMHDSIGLDKPHTTFYLPDGQSSDGWETWTLVQNPNDKDVQIEIDYLLAGGGIKKQYDTVKANSRQTYSMTAIVPNVRAGIVVTGNLPIMVERAMYFNNRGGGTDTIGGYSD